MVKRKKSSSRGLGDDPLKWIKDEAAPADLRQPLAPGSPSTATENGSDAPIVLDSVITIAEAAALKDQLLHHVNRKGEITVDGSRVESVDTAALQVLLAFVRNAQGRGAVVRWTGVSDALLGTAELLGVAKQIGLRVRN